MCLFGGGPPQSNAEKKVVSPPPEGGTTGNVPEPAPADKGADFVRLNEKSNKKRTGARKLRIKRPKQSSSGSTSSTTSNLSKAGVNLPR